MASVSIGRSRLPPDEMRWFATSGIMATCDPVRARMVALTRSMSAATSSLNRSSDAGRGLSKGTMTAKTVSDVGWRAYKPQWGAARASGRAPRGSMERGGLTHYAPYLGQRITHGGAGGGGLRELVRTNNAVLVSAVGALLAGARIHYVVLDQNMSVRDQHRWRARRPVAAAPAAQRSPRRSRRDPARRGDRRADGRMRARARRGSWCRRIGACGARRRTARGAG